MAGRALVTGAGTGIGCGIALELAKAGYDVGLHYCASREGAEAAAGSVVVARCSVSTVNGRAGVLLLAEPVVEVAIAEARRLKPSLLIADSVQTMLSERVPAVPGSVTQVREVASLLLETAKRGGPPVVLVGHVTKEGLVAGPKSLEHLVDAVLEFSGAEFMVRGRGYAHSVADFENIVVKTAGGVPVLLKDVANVELGPEIRRGIADLDGLGDHVGGRRVGQLLLHPCHLGQHRLGLCALLGVQSGQFLVEGGGPSPLCEAGSGFGAGGLLAPHGALTVGGPEAHRVHLRMGTVFRWGVGVPYLPTTDRKRGPRSPPARRSPLQVRRVERSSRPRSRGVVRGCRLSAGTLRRFGGGAGSHPDRRGSTTEGRATCAVIGHSTAAQR